MPAPAPLAVAFAAILAAPAFALPPGWEPPRLLASTAPLISAQYGLPAPATIDPAARVRINNAGDVAFPFFSSAPFQPNGVWVNGVNTMPANRPAQHLSLSESGRALWYGPSNSGPAGLYSYDARSGVSAFHGQGPGAGFGQSSPAVNDSLDVAVWAAPGGQPRVTRHNLTTGVGGPVAGLTGVSPGVSRLLDMNNAGQIAFYDGGGPFPRVQRVGPDNATTAIETGLGGVSRVYEAVSINAAGAVAYFRQRGTNELVIGDGLTSAVVARAGGPNPFRAFDLSTTPPAINDAGWVAFLAQAPDLAWGLYLTDGLTTSRIIGDGDLVQTPLGPRAANLGGFRGFDINARGDAVVLVGLGDAGASVVRLNAVPAPGAAGLLSAPLVMAARRRRTGTTRT